MRSLLRITFLMVALVLTRAAPQAMSFSQFDELSMQDRAGFINFMVSAAQQTLIDVGRRDLGQKVLDLFTSKPDAEISVGRAVFEKSLAAAQVRHAQNPTTNPTLLRNQVEVVMTSTLKNMGIDTNPEFLRGFVQRSNSFQPKNPPK